MMVPMVYCFARIAIGVLVLFVRARLGQQPLILVVERVSVVSVVGTVGTVGTAGTVLTVGTVDVVAIELVVALPAALPAVPALPALPALPASVVVQLPNRLVLVGVDAVGVVGGTFESYRLVLSGTLELELFPSSAVVLALTVQANGWYLFVLFLRMRPVADVADVVGVNRLFYV
jgi:hypothetical protein